MVSGQELQVQEKRELQKKEESTAPVRMFLPTTDIYETDQALTVVMEMPGVDKEKVEINVEDGVLTVEGRIDFRQIPRPSACLHRVQHWQLPPQLRPVEQHRPRQNSRRYEGRRADPDAAESGAGQAEKDHGRLTRSARLRGKPLAQLRFQFAQLGGTG